MNDTADWSGINFGNRLLSPKETLKWLGQEAILGQQRKSRLWDAGSSPRGLGENGDQSVCPCEYLDEKW
jgi:hypothetical protein